MADSSFVCMICSKEFPVTSATIFELHVNRCLDNKARTKSKGKTRMTEEMVPASPQEAVDPVKCPLCGKDITHLSALRRDQHSSRCADSVEERVAAARERDQVLRQEGQAPALQPCRLCGYELHGKSSSIRVNHLKQCARLHGVGAVEYGMIDVQVRDEGARDTLSTLDQSRGSIGSTVPETPSPQAGGHAHGGKNSNMVVRMVYDTSKPISSEAGRQELIINTTTAAATRSTAATLPTPDAHAPEASGNPPDRVTDIKDLGKEEGGRNGVDMVVESRQVDDFVRPCDMMPPPNLAQTARKKKQKTPYALMMEQAKKESIREHLANKQRQARAQEARREDPVVMAEQIRQESIRRRARPADELIEQAFPASSQTIARSSKVDDDEDHHEGIQVVTGSDSEDEREERGNDDGDDGDDSYAVVVLSDQDKGATTPVSIPPRSRLASRLGPSPSRQSIWQATGLGILSPTRTARVIEYDDGADYDPVFGTTQEAVNALDRLGQWDGSQVFDLTTPSPAHKPILERSSSQQPPIMDKEEGDEGDEGGVQGGGGGEREREEGQDQEMAGTMGTAGPQPLHTASTSEPSSQGLGSQLGSQPLLSSPPRSQHVIAIPSSSPLSSPMLSGAVLHYSPPSATNHKEDAASVLNDSVPATDSESDDPLPPCIPTGLAPASALGEETQVNPTPSTGTTLSAPISRPLPPTNTTTMGTTTTTAKNVADKKGRAKGGPVKPVKPDFDHMGVAELKKRIQNIGLKACSKSKMIQKLSQVWDLLHAPRAHSPTRPVNRQPASISQPSQPITAPDAAVRTARQPLRLHNEAADPSIPASRPTTRAVGGNTTTTTTRPAVKAKAVRARAKPMLEAGGPQVTRPIKKRKRVCKSSSDATLIAHIRTLPHIYDKMLVYEPVFLDDVHLDMNRDDQGVRCSKKYLGEFLEQQGVGFVNRSELQNLRKSSQGPS